MATSGLTSPTATGPTDDADAPAHLGPLAGLAGTWRGSGFNIAAHPDFQNRGDAIVDLSLTSDTITFDPIPAVIHNRGFAQPDIELFGLSYLQHSHDAVTGGPLHIEPGMWINQPSTTHPPAEPPAGGRLIARMWSIPHGASFVAQGFALPFTGPPVISPGAQRVLGGNPAFSSFPSFNSTPILPAFPDRRSAIFSATGSAAQAGPAGGCSGYTLAGSRTLPADITQQLVNDPVVLLQRTIDSQLSQGYRFDGVALNIATAAEIRFQHPPVKPGNPAPPTDSVHLPQFGGGIVNLAFLRGSSEQAPNLSAALVYATFWLERLTHPDGRPPILQLQYAQTALVNFPVYAIAGQPNVSWPHVSVSTLRRV